MRAGALQATCKMDAFVTIGEGKQQDEQRELIDPLGLGKGQRLFEDESTAQLRLVYTTTFSSSVVTLTYQPEEKAQCQQE
jgi:hypothetical protein